MWAVLNDFFHPFFSLAYTSVHFCFYWQCRIADFQPTPFLFRKLVSTSGIRVKEYIMLQVAWAMYVRPLFFGPGS